MNKNKIIIRQHNYNLSSPDQMVKMAGVLKNYIIKNNLCVKIAGKDYISVEGWQFAGGLLGTLPKIAAVENISNGQEIKWQAQAEIVDIKTGKTVGSGFAVCSNKEVKKKTFDEYAVLSMAQTRAIGKAYRNVIGWVVKLAGYESTPAEEIKTEAVVADKVSEKGLWDETTKIIAHLTAMGFKTDAQKMDGIKRLTGIKVNDWADMTKEEAKTILVAVLAKKNEKK